jgi:hypothetical protein
MNLDGRIEYTRLLKLAQKGCGRMLDTHVHRYLAVVKTRRAGMYSTLELACRVVDEGDRQPKPGMFWGLCPAAQGESYVVDLVAGQIYERTQARPCPLVDSKKSARKAQKTLD